MKITLKSGGSLKVFEKNERCLLSDLIKESGFNAAMPCAGGQRCGKCRVSVLGGVSPMTEKEQKLLPRAPQNIRLACMTYAEESCEVEIVTSDLNGLSDGFTSKFPYAPMAGDYGFAVDIGTTTVAVYGYDLKENRCFGKDVFVNPQSAYGADVISRIEASLAGNGGELSSLIVQNIQTSFLKLCRENSVEESAVGSAVLTGNTAMLYLLLQKSVEPLSRAPFEIDDYLGHSCNASKIGFSAYSNMRLYFPRTMSAFVGSDITCAVLSANDLMTDKKAALLIDIGTNGEMALSSGEKLLCCSTAAGPAFEGAGITMGSMATTGAINKVWYAEGQIHYTTIENGEPTGICGSGLIDAVAAFIEAGLIDETGCIDETAPDYITESGGESAIKIGDSDVIITGRDIRAVQLAKSAVCAGVYSLLHGAGLTPEMVDVLIIAGGFGSFINVKNAAKIGLIPPPLAEKAVAVGNASGMGASAILLSESARGLSETLAKKSETVDLGTSAYFMEKYVECMMF